MDNPVVIKKVSHGEKGYVGDYKGPSYPYSTYYTQKPFSDPNVQKFNLEDALKIVQTTQISSPFEVIQIVDISGKVYYDNHNERFVYKDKKHMKNVANDLKNIMNEEIKKFLNESVVVDDEKFKFVEQIKMYDPQRGFRIYFYNYDNFSNDYDTDIIDAVVNIKWSVGFWVNNYGVENFFIRINGVEGTYKLELRDKHTDEVVQESDKNINDTKWNFNVDEQTILHTNSSLYVKELTFDFKNQTCTVEFYQVAKD